MKVKTYRDLKVWQRGMDLAKLIYRETASMPKAEMFGLTSQMRRAATSIPMNIAEGFGKHTRPELLRGLRLATGSLFELMTAWELTVSLELLKPCPEIIASMAELDRMVSAMIKKLEAKPRA